jgi:diguanylate cyclase (GGDEF)-like protein
MNRFSLTSVFTFLIFSGTFAYMSNGKMTLLAGSCAAIWFIVYLAYQKQHSRILFLLGVVITALFALFTIFNFGWSSGFFYLLLTIIPLVYLNTKSKKVLKILLGIMLCGGVVVVHLLTFTYSPTINMGQLNLRTLYCINLILAVTTLSVIGYFFERAALAAEESLVLANKQLGNLAATDPLTNLSNRRTMMLRIDQEKNHLERNGKPFSLIMIDIDNFKEVNDEYGHDGGDFVLINLSRLINLCVRKQDQVARWGGDEFLVFLPETTLEGGRIVAEKIRSRILTSPFIYQEMDIPVTVTLGVSTCNSTIGIGSCIRKVDIALYTGKQAGKNRVILGS